MNDLGIVVVSCDKNKWLLDIFFDQYCKNWKRNGYNLYLAMEEDKYDKIDLNIKNVTCGKNSTWCSRLAKTLKYVNEEYILILLDDFIIESNVNDSLLEKYLKYMKEDDLYNIILTPVVGEKNQNTCKYFELEHRNRFGRYKTSLQCGLWKRSILIKLLSNNESAWEFEIFGNIRSFIEKNKFFAVKNTKFKPIEYNDGFFVVQGRVNLEEKKRLENKLNMEISIGNISVAEKENIIRDEIKIFPRIIRRIKIIVLYCKYYLEYRFKGDQD